MTVLRNSGMYPHCPYTCRTKTLIVGNSCAVISEQVCVQSIYVRVAGPVYMLISFYVNKFMFTCSLSYKCKYLSWFWELLCTCVLYSIPLAKKVVTVSLLDSNRSRNIEIFLPSFPLSLANLTDTLDTHLNNIAETSPLQIEHVVALKRYILVLTCYTYYICNNFWWIVTSDLL